MNVTQINFDRMMEQEITPLRNYALSLTHDMDDTKDLVQDTILKSVSLQGSVFKPAPTSAAGCTPSLKNSFINNYTVAIKSATPF